MRKIITFSFALLTSLVFSQGTDIAGDVLFEKMKYLDAAKKYEIDIENGDESKEILQKIGDAYYFNTNMKAANKWYGVLMSKYSDEIQVDYIFRYAQSFKGIGKYGTSRIWMKKIIEKSSDNVDEFVHAEVEINKLEVKDYDFTLNNLSINTRFSDFAPMYYGDKLIYASSKQTTGNQGDIKSSNEHPFFNLYIGNFGLEKSDIIESEDFSKVLKSGFHEATLAFSSDLNKVYYTRNNYNGNERVRNNAINRLKLYSATASEENDGKIDWVNSKELPFNSVAYSVGHPTLSADGKKLYFVSDMPGTIGKTDVFVVDVLGDDEYSEPRNLGIKVNTPGKEMFPFITGKTLYFSSDGHKGIGGLDIFESHLNNNSFETPINLGSTLNSISDDFSYIVDETTNSGFVCSNRNLGKGDDDIYFFEIKPCEQFLNGFVSNNLTGEKLVDATVTLYGKSGVMIEETETEINGKYAFSKRLNCNTEYRVKAQKRGFADYEKKILTNENKGENSHESLGLNVKNKLIVEEKGLLKIKIGTIYFDNDKFNIGKETALEFDKVVLLMNEFPSMVIKIESHTDSRGSDDFNLILSDKRAKATREYIISKGINSLRIESALGHGEIKLVNKCKNGVICSDLLHQLNRRSEFIILKM